MVLSLRERRCVELRDINTSFKIPLKKRIINVSSEGIATYFTLGEELVAGKWIRVFEATRQNDQDGRRPYLVKRIRKYHRVDEQSWRSVAHAILNAPHSVHIPVEEVLYDADYFYLIQRKCSEHFQTVSVSEVKHIVRESLLCVKQLLGFGKIHRDAKENTIFEHSGSKLQLIDVEPWAPCTPPAPRPGLGTPQDRVDSPLSDLWSVGLVLYVLMVGELPCDMELIRSVDESGSESPNLEHKSYQRVSLEKIDWNDDPWPEYPLARDLCQRLLDVSTECHDESATDALQHPFIA